MLRRKSISKKKPRGCFPPSLPSPTAAFYVRWTCPIQGHYVGTKVLLKTSKHPATRRSPETNENTTQNQISKQNGGGLTRCKIFLCHRVAGAQYRSRGPPRSGPLRRRHRRCDASAYSIKTSWRLFSEQCDAGF